MTQPPVPQLPQLQGSGDDPPGPPVVTAVKRRNAYAIIGIVLAVLIWPLGLIFSIIGLVKSKARGGSGKTLSIVGIALSAISLVGPVQTLQSELNIAEARARQPSVRADVGAMAGDLGTMMSALQAVLHGNANGVYQVSSAGDAVIGESTSLIPLCTP
jgi:hypothetical protein